MNITDEEERKKFHIRKRKKNYSHSQKEIISIPYRERRRNKRKGWLVEKPADRSECVDR